jgi:hypothetical protein
MQDDSSTNPEKETQLTATKTVAAVADSREAREVARMLARFDRDDAP